MSGVSQAHDTLDQSWQRLRRQWQASRDQWSDPVSQSFEREYWQEHERLLPATMERLQALAEVIAHARRAVK